MPADKLTYLFEILQLVLTGTDKAATAMVWQ
jgi:hypothetical protein